MARIFLAREKTDLGGDRLIVVKEILPLLASSEEMSKLLIDEAKLCATLSHKNVVQVADLGREQDSLYIAMEYVEGLDLRDLLRGCSQKKVPLPVQFSLFIVSEVLHALDYAHRRRSEDGRPPAASCTETSRRRTYFSRSRGRSSSATSRYRTSARDR